MEEIIKRIQELGLDKEKNEELFEILSEEVLEILFEDLTENSSDEELQTIENRIKESKSTQHYETIIKEIAITVYGEQAEQEIKNIYLDLLDSYKKLIDDTRDLLQRANAGDPEAQKLIEEAKQTDYYKNIVEEE